MPVVRLLGLDNQANEVELGRVTLAQGQLSVTPASLDILSKPIFVMNSQGVLAEITASTPQEFLSGLVRQYKSPYFHATAPEENFEYDANQPRDDHGRFGSKVSEVASTITADMTRDPGYVGGQLTAAHQQSYQAALHRVLTKMPETALNQLQNGLSKVEWFRDTYFLKSRAIAQGLTGVRPGESINGTFNMETGLCRLDGLTTKRNASGLGGDQENIHGTYAHELCHAIDRGRRYSNTPEWQSAYAAEIQSGDHLTRYAQTDAMEGFAEFGRALYGSDVPHKTIQEKFPKCWDFFVKQRLVEV